MRTETITRTIYTAAELKEAHPKGFDRALQKHARYIGDDPHWAEEHRESLKAALAALGDKDELPEIEGTRRVMAWVENKVLDALRLPWSPYWLHGQRTKRAKLAEYGAFYRPGMVKPCPWTGYCVDDDLLDVIVKGAKAGDSPREIRRAVERKAERLWDAEMEAQCSEEYFLEAADGNGWEYYENGEMA